MRKAGLTLFSGLFALFSLGFPLHSSAAPIPYPDGGSIAAWGLNSENQCNVPAPNEGFVAISSQHQHSLAVRTDGSVAAWGRDTYGVLNVPMPNSGFIDVSAGWYHSLGLKTDGSIAAWGAGTTNTGVNPHYGQSIVPEPNTGFAAVAAGGLHSLGLKRIGSIEAWGRNLEQQCEVPEPNEDFIAVAAQGNYSMALKKIGRIVQWGFKGSRPDVPEPNEGFIAIAAGGDHSLGLKNTGIIVAWGSNSAGQCNVPSPNQDFIAIAAGGNHSLGLKSNGTIVAWGSNSNGQLNVPSPNVGFVAVAAGASHSLGGRVGCIPAEGFPEGFDAFDTGARPAGWNFTGIGDEEVFTESGSFGVASPALKLSEVGDSVWSRPFARPQSVYFWLMGIDAGDTTLLVEEYYVVGEVYWQKVEEIIGGEIPATGQTMGPYPLNKSATRVRFTYTQGSGQLAFDDVSVCRYPVTPTPVLPARLVAAPGQFEVYMEQEPPCRDEYLVLRNLGDLELEFEIIIREPKPSPTPIQYLLRIFREPNEAAGNTSPLPGEHYYPPGTVVALLATAGPGYEFFEWIVDGVPGQPNPTQVLMDGNKIATVRFQLTGGVASLSSAEDESSLSVRPGISAEDEVEWLDAEPTTGVIAAGGQKTIKLTFCYESDLPLYNRAEILIRSNDPASPLRVPVVLAVPAKRGPISGWVYHTTASGALEGIPNVRVLARGLLSPPLLPPGFTDTDEGGFYEIGFNPPLQRGFYQIDARPRFGSGFKPGRYPFPVATGSSGINIALEKVELADISGRVFDSLTGKGLKNFLVTAKGQTPAETGGFAATDDSGNYRIQDLQDYFFTLTARPMDPITSRDYAPMIYPITISPPATGINFGMVKGGEIYGRVYDELTGKGVPEIIISGRPYGATSIWEVAATTDASGDYRLKPLSTGWYELRAETGQHDGRYPECFLDQWYYQRLNLASADPVKTEVGKAIRKDWILLRCFDTTPTPAPRISPSPTPPGEIEIWQIWGGVPGDPNSGGGQATLIHNPLSGISVMYDCGSEEIAREALYLMNELGMQAGDLDCLIVSNYDVEHIGGIPYLFYGTGEVSTPALVQFGIGQPTMAVYDRGGTHRAVFDGGPIPDPAYLTAVAGKRQTWQVGGEIDLGIPGGEAIIRCMAIGNPNNISGPVGGKDIVHIFNRADITTGKVDENAKSLVVHVSYGGFDLYLGGDSSSKVGDRAPVEETVGDVIRNDLGRRVDVLVVNNHGSVNHTSEKFLSLIGPSAAIIPVWENPFDYPSSIVLERLKAAVECGEGRQSILQTSLGSGVADVCGLSANAHIRVRTDSNFYTIDTFDVPGRTTDRVPLSDPKWINHPVNRIPLPIPVARDPNLVISQVATRGSLGEEDIFVEIYNPFSHDLDLGAWRLQYAGASAAAWDNILYLPLSTTLPSYYYMLFTHPFYDDPDSGDFQFGTNIESPGGHLRMLDKWGREQDRVGWGTAVAPEGKAISPIHGVSGSYLRKVNEFSTAVTMLPGGYQYLYGNLYDSDNNFIDFVVLGSLRDPRNRQAGLYPPQPGLPQPLSRPVYREWLLPAGGTQINGFQFDQYVLIYNIMDEEPAQVEITFVGENGPITSINRIVAPRNRFTVKVNDHVGNFRPAVSTLVSVKNNADVVCEKAMYWSPGSIPWAGGHVSIGIPRAATKWYLAEGATHAFDQFVHVLNPNFVSVAAKVTFVNQFGQSWEVEKMIDPRSTWTLDARSVAGIQTQLSTQVTADLSIAVERTMYWDRNGIRWIDGHASIGVVGPSLSWNLAEGATHIFDEYVLAANFSTTSAARVRFAFMDKHGNTTFHIRMVEPMSRYTVKASDFVGITDQVSTMVSSDNNVPIVAERAMYWKADGVPWAGGHSTIGASSPALTWYLPEGATHIFDQYVLVANPSFSIPAQVKFTFSDASGNSWVHTMEVEPLSRYTVKANNVAGVISQLATKVESLNGVPIIAERAMYWNPGGVRWGSGHATIGFSGF